MLAYLYVSVSMAFERTVIGDYLLRYLPSGGIRESPVDEFIQSFSSHCGWLCLEIHDVRWGIRSIKVEYFELRPYHLLDVFLLLVRRILGGCCWSPTYSLLMSGKERT